MAEYNDIISLSRTKIFLRDYCMDRYEFIQKFLNALMSIMDYANITDIIYIEDEKAVAISLPKDPNFRSLTEKYGHDIALAYMAVLNDYELVNFDGVIIPSDDVINKIVEARCSIPAAQCLYNVLFFDTFPEHDTIKIKL